MLVDQILDAKGRDVATVAPDASIADAVRELADRNVGALVVSADGSSVDGIVSERDIVRRLAAEPDVLSRRVSELMVHEVATCDCRTGIDELMGTMTARRFRHVPVVQDGRLCGIVSIGDVVKARIDELATETQQLVGYIQNGR
ncbi:MAG TPA: CBS domain-containing protein [Acidimicrobiales bacterium]|nr:CBS domain-containing protein [Acidimicrobiales bacterium]